MPVIASRMEGAPAPAANAHPLGATVERANGAHDWLTLVLGPPVPDDWLRCSAVDTTVITEWEAIVARGHHNLFGRSHPMAATGYVLGWYADIPSGLGALCFLADRRVPRLGRHHLAFHRAPSGYPDGIGVLDPRFWCLPSDPAAGHSDATVVADEGELAAVLRAEVRTHADDFLATFRPGARLPRRSLLGAFFDGLDTGFWVDDSLLATRRDVLTAARTVLPGATPHFPEPTRFYTAVDQAGREHLARRRVSCCYYFKVGEDGACTTCPRTSDAERLRRLSESDAACTATEPDGEILRG